MPPWRMKKRLFSSLATLDPSSAADARRVADFVRLAAVAGLGASAGGGSGGALARSRVWRLKGFL